MTSPATVCLLAKAPEPGRAKSRLARALGRAGAAALARAFLLDALDTWEESTGELLVAHTGCMDASLRRRLEPFARVSQGEGSLGERMERVLRRALEHSDAAMVVGTDVPGLGEADYQRAMHALQTHDAVLGPAEDGGFTLLALRRCEPGLLRGLPWSSSQTLLCTRRRLEGAGLSVALLEPRFDVDVPADLGRLGQHVRVHPGAMPHTEAFLGSAHNQAISVIVPVLNEAARLPRLLRSLIAAGFAECIVVDGGSTDSSVAIVSSFPRVRLVHAPAGRARQMNRGAQVATGGTLLFLHADTELPEDALEKIRDCLSGQTHVAGAFRLHTRYDPLGRHRPWVTPLLRLADLRSRYTRYPYGDQGLFVRADCFRQLGGYPDLPIFEDLALSQALHQVAPLKIAKADVKASGRRFQDRPLYYVLLMNSLPLLYRLGIAPGRLSRLYHETR